MPTFEYNSVTSSGRLMKGTIEASSLQQASEMLTEMGLLVNELTAAGKKRAKTAIGRSEFLLFNQQLASITKAGIPLDQGLRELASDVSGGHMKRLITEIAEDLERGMSIEEAVEKRQRKFPRLYSEILKAGVKTGRLSEMLTSLNRHLEMKQRTQRMIIESLCYPVVIMVLGLAVAFGIFNFIIPTFAEILSGMGSGARLPFLTQLMIDIANNIVPIGIGVAAIISILLVTYVLMSSNDAGRRAKESVILGMPVLGRLYHNSILARMADSMALLVAAGCGMGECLRLAAGSSGSSKMKKESDLLAGQIEQGQALMEAGAFSRMIPRLFLYSAQMGSQRNELQDNLRSLSEMYTEQARCHQARVYNLLMPLILIFVGLLIGLVITAMFLPAISIITVLM